MIYYPKLPKRLKKDCPIGVSCRNLLSSRTTTPLLERKTATRWEMQQWTFQVWWARKGAGQTYLRSCNLYMLFASIASANSVSKCRTLSTISLPPAATLYFWSLASSFSFTCNMSKWTCHILHKFWAQTKKRAAPTSTVSTKHSNEEIDQNIRHMCTKISSWPIAI